MLFKYVAYHLTKKKGIIADLIDGKPHAESSGGRWRGNTVYTGKWLWGYRDRKNQRGVHGNAGKQAVVPERMENVRHQGGYGHVFQGIHAPFSSLESTASHPCFCLRIPKLHHHVFMAPRGSKKINKLSSVSHPAGYVFQGIHVSFSNSGSMASCPWQSTDIAVAQETPKLHFLTAHQVGYQKKKKV